MDKLTALNNAIQKASDYTSHNLAKAQEYARPALRKAVKKTNHYTPKIIQNQIDCGVKWVRTQADTYNQLKIAEEQWWTRWNNIYDLPPSDDMCSNDEVTRQHELDEARLELERREREGNSDQRVETPVLLDSGDDECVPTPERWAELDDGEVKRAREYAGRQKQKQKEMEMEMQRQMEEELKVQEEEELVNRFEDSRGSGSEVFYSCVSSFNYQGYAGGDEQQEDWDDDSKPFDPTNTRLLSDGVTKKDLKWLSQDPEFSGSSLKHGEKSRSTKPSKKHHRESRCH